MMDKPVMTWTCTKCGWPVAGPYAKCENCSWHPTRKSETSKPQEQQEEVILPPEPQIISPATCWCRKCLSWVAPLDGKCPKCHNSDTLESKFPGNQTKPPNDPINPNHYRSHPSGVEAITITEHANYNLGNAIKYIWRFAFGETQIINDLKKAKWYLDREIARHE